MAPPLSKFVNQKTVLGAASISVILFLAKLNSITKNARKRQQEGELKFVVGEKNVRRGTSEKAQVDMSFFRQVARLLKHAIPGLFTAEVGYMLLVAGSLITRSMCDIWMINNGTLIESAIIGQKPQLFMKRLTEFASAMPLISLVNNLLKLGIDELKLRLRTRMTQSLYDQYLNGYTYYKMSNLDSRISNADQLLTTDVEKFCNSVVDLYSNILKPLLDIVIYVHKLTTSLGGQAPSMMIGYLIFSGLLLTRMRRPAGRMTVTEQRLEGEFRYVNSRIITHSEEIAFYQGNKREKVTVMETFQRLVDHLRKFLEFRFIMGFVDNIIAKYIATVVGFFVVSRPFLIKSSPLTNKGHTERLQEYYTSGRMLVKLAEAIGRLVLAGREMTRLAGYTARVTELVKVISDLNRGHYERTMVNDGRVKNEPLSKTVSSRMPLIPGAGRIITKDNIIRFENVPLVTPNGDVLVEELSFEVLSGMNVLVCGPNGCGKSSLFRILGELWPVFGGTLTKPPPNKLFYIPQRPYMTLGTLRDQVIYPHCCEDMLRLGVSDNDLIRFLDQVSLGYLLEREGGWNAVADWMDVLSGGEKQRIAMSRLFYHKPQFAILDECTSAVSVDVEGSMYQYCREAGISLFTVSHRKSLWKHHEFYLHMDGRGSFEFKPIESDTEEFGS